MFYTQGTLKDLDSIVQMRMNYIYEDYKTISQDDKQLILKQLPEYFIKHLGKDVFAFIAKNNDKIVSMALLVVMEKPANMSFKTGLVGEVLSVITLEQYRRQGIATNVLKSLIDFAKNKKLNYVKLSASEDGYPLYKKLGFKEKEKSKFTEMKYLIS